MSLFRSDVVHDFEGKDLSLPRSQGRQMNGVKTFIGKLG
jgi:hypothetical protein